MRFPIGRGLEVLEGALAIGRQADTLPVSEMRTRMEVVQAQATNPASATDTPLFTRIKGWLSAKADTVPAD